MPDKNEVQMVDQQGGQGQFLTIFQIAAEKGYDPDFIEKMMALQERNDINNARKAYHEAMAAFKANPPEIEKDKKVSYSVQGKGTTAYNHASLANVTAKINKALSDHGLSAAWATDQKENGITVTCTITHKLGHSERTSITANPDTSGSKNSIQAIGSTITYLERYTLLALTGLATKDMDDDGQSATVEYITDQQLSTITNIINDRGIDEAKFLEYLGAESLDKIPAKDFNRAMSAAKSKKKKEE